MKITGELLKAERLKQGLAVADVANSLKLSSRIINSIEAGDISELPAKTFIRGFVKSYAQFLKLDADLILRQFLEEMGSTQPLPKTPPPQATTGDSRPKNTRVQAPVNASSTSLDLNRDNKKKTAIYISIAIMLLIFILVINNVVEKYQKESRIDKKEVAQIQPLKTPENVLVPIEAPAASAAATPSASASPANADATSGASKSAMTSPSTDLTAKSTTEPPSKSSVGDVSVVTTAPTDFEPSLARPVEVIIVAKKDTEFYYAKGNTKDFTKVKLAVKEIQVIRSQSGLHLKAEDGSSIGLILNGVEKGQASGANKPIRLTF